MTTRQGAAAAGLAALFAFGAIRQALVLYAGNTQPWQPGPESAAEIALLGVALGGVLALRSLRRTTRERDRVEDLHWDSMEAVRVMSELAARPGAGLSDKLDTVLELGAARFGLETGLAWRAGDDDGEGELLGLRTDVRDEEQREALTARLLPRMREAARADRPHLHVDSDQEPRALFCTPVRVDGRLHGALGFAGSRDAADAFTATDKDVLRLMAQWLAAELERNARAAQPEPAPERAPGHVHAPEMHALATPAPEPAALDKLPTLRSLRPRGGRDLNAAVRRAERRLRRRLGVDATLEVSLGHELPPAGPGRLSLSTLVESVALAAARLAPTGRVTLETQRVAGAADVHRAGEVMLCVRVDGEGIDAAALKRVFDAPDDPELVDGRVLPLARIERLLRRDGGDLSVTVEPRRGAVLTAYLPPTATAPARTAAPRATARPF